MHLGKVIDESLTLFGPGAVNHREVFGSDVKAKTTLASLNNSSEMGTLNDSATDLLVFLAEDTALDSCLPSLFLGHTRGNNDLNSHGLEFRDCTPVLQLCLIAILRTVEHTDRLKNEVVKGGDF